MFSKTPKPELVADTAAGPDIARRGPRVASLIAEDLRIEGGLTGEVELHTRLLRTLDTVLIPRARDQQLRQILVSVRPAVAAHLEHARTLTARTH